MDKFLKEKNIQLNKGFHYTLRITKDGLEKFEILKRLKEMVDYKSGLVAREEASKEHFHCFIEYKRSLVEKDVKALRRFITSTFEVEGTQYSLKKVTKKFSALVYNLKEGDYCYDGFDEKFIEALKKLSYHTKPDKFMEEWDAIKLEYMGNNSHNEHWLATQLIVLKAKYNQNITDSSIKGQVKMIAVKRDGYRKAEEYASAIFFTNKFVGYD